MSEKVPIEIEKKYRIDAAESESLDLRLHELGAEYRGETAEENIIFSNDHLEAIDAVLRLRKVGSRTLLTFKRRIPGDEAIKSQVEEETEVADVKATERIILALGLRRKLVYEKHRRIWRFNDTEIVLDELPFGHFMEIEAPKEKIRVVEGLLGIEGHEAVVDTYPALTARFGTKVGSVIEARFG